MIEQDISKLPVITKVKIICDNCESIYEKTIKNRKVSYKKFNKDLCKNCAHKEASKKRPQCKKSFWTEDKKLEHGNIIKENENYKIGIENRLDINGENNPMYGKTHTKKTKQKMSKSRTGKIGQNATAWKGGKLSLVRRVKSYQYRNNWYSEIYKRDNYKCTKCNSKTKIEVHHIKPMKDIINENKNKFDNDDDRYNYLITLDINNKLNNGITLCRKCHKEIHLNWGSHNPKIKENEQ